MALQCSPSHLQISFTFRRWLLWVALLAAASAGVMSRFVRVHRQALAVSRSFCIGRCCTVHPIMECAELEITRKRFVRHLPSNHAQSAELCKCYAFSVMSGS